MSPFKLIERQLDRFDAFQRRSKPSGFAYAVLKKYGEDEAGHRAALLAYYGFLSLFPLLLVLTTVVRIILQNDSHLSQQIIDDASAYFPVIGNELQQNVHSLSQTGLALWVGVLLTLFGARGVADAFRGGLNHIWEVPYVKRSGFPGSMLRSFGIIIIGGTGLLLAPLLSGYAVGFSHGLGFRILSIAVTLTILFGVFLFIIRLAVSVKLPLSNIWVGAATAAVSLVILQSFGGYILAHEMKNLNNLYGTFAIVLGLIFWIYIQTQVLFYAFEIDTVRVNKLWPRSLRGSMTSADRKAYEMYAGRATYRKSR